MHSDVFCMFSITQKYVIRNARVISFAAIDTGVWLKICKSITVHLVMRKYFLIIFLNKYLPDTLYIILVN